jgi:hypothetical protein
VGNEDKTYHKITRRALRCAARSHLQS